jgi:ATP-dependent exoDNAse (exonuclease V) beta subunit
LFSQALQEGPGSVVFEEEKRLCYVAMTRAKTELVMSWREEVPVFTKDGMRYVTRKRSRFLDVLVSKTERDSAEQKRSFSSTSSRQNDARPAYGNALRPKSSPLSAIPNKLTGTASVYAKKSPLSLERLAPTSIAAKTPASQMSTSTNRSPTRTTSNPQRPVQAKKPMAPLQPKKAQPPQVRESSQPGSVDSTWFFPVGSKVRHLRLGDGIVLPPHSLGNDATNMIVVVKFSNGDRREFPVQTADLSPIVM